MASSMSDILDSLKSKSLSDGNIISFIYILLGGLALCAIAIGLVALNKGIQRRRKKATVLAQTKENLEKLEHILSSQTSVDVRNFFILSVPTLFRTIFLDVLQGFEHFSQLRGYQSLLSFHSFPDNKIGFKYTVGLAGVGVSASQAKADFADYIDRIHSFRDFDTKVIFLDPERIVTQDVLLKKHLIRIQKAFHAADEYQSTIHRLFTTITEKGFSPIPITKPLDPLPDTSIQQKSAVGEFCSTEGKVYLDPAFTKRNQQIDLLERFIIRLVQNPQTRQATVVLEQTRNAMIETDSPDNETTRAWLKQAAHSIEQSDLEPEDIDLLKEVYASFHVEDLLPKQWK